MEMKNQFEVKPVRSYDGARYPSPWAPVPVPEDAADTPTPLSMLILALLLVLGLSVGAIGCFAEYGSQKCPGDLPRDANGLCPPGPDPECDAGALACEDGVLQVCDDDGMGWTGQACEDYCREMYGADYWSTGCDAQAEDPCQCQYDIIDGDIAECTPGDFYCNGDGNVSICNDDHWSWSIHECNDYCRETYGADFVSYGCSDDAEAPCLCDYDMIDGVWAGCEPGEIYCQDDETLMTCNEEDRYSYDEHDCAEYCVEVYGEDYYSNGCDASDADNPCGCEYGIVDGEPVDP